MKFLSFAPENLIKKSIFQPFRVSIKSSEENSDLLSPTSVTRTLSNRDKKEKTSLSRNSSNKDRDCVKYINERNSNNVSCV